MSSLEDELQQLEAAIQARPDAVSRAALQKHLRLVRDLGVHDPAMVAQTGGRLLKAYKGSLSEEEGWLVHEQFAVAALECGAVKVAGPFVAAVLKRFPDSVRAKRLQGMWLEAAGQVSKAQELYKEVLKAEPTNANMLKRLVGLEKTKGNTLVAIDVLRRYLEAFQNDKEAWEELAELYLESLQYRQALFCYEELLLLAPGSAVYHCRLADVLYTLGGSANLRTARAYYSRAVALSSAANVRALMGLCAVAAQLAEKEGGRKSSGEVPQVYAAAGAALRKHYKKEAPGKLPALEKMLQSLGV